MTITKKGLLGVDSPGDQKIGVTIRNWIGLQLALWRSKVSWDIAHRAAQEIVDRCEHVDGCPGLEDESAPCISDRYEQPPEEGAPAVLVDKGCPDREQRMSALVILNAARRFAPIEARQPAHQPYFAPSREYFSEVLADLLATQAERDALRAALGIETPAPEPPPNDVKPALSAPVARLPAPQQKESP